MGSKESNMTGRAYAELPDFEELDDDLIDLACSTGALYRVDFHRAWEVVREGLRASHGQAPAGEVVAARYDFDGYGWRYIDNGSGSDWATRHPDAEPLVLAAAPTPAPEENTDYKILWDYVEENLVYADFKGGGYVNYIGWPDKDRRETLREEILLKALL